MVAQIFLSFVVIVFGNLCSEFVLNFYQVSTSFSLTEGLHIARADLCGI